MAQDCQNYLSGGPETIMQDNRRHTEYTSRYVYTVNSHQRYFLAVNTNGSGPIKNVPLYLIFLSNSAVCESKIKFSHHIPHKQSQLLIRQILPQTSKLAYSERNERSCIMVEVSRTQLINPSFRQKFIWSWKMSLVDLNTKGMDTQLGVPWDKFSFNGNAFGRGSSLHASRGWGPETEAFIYDTFEVGGWFWSCDG